MTLEAFSTKWFVIYYSVLGILLIGGGSYFILKKEQLANFTLEATKLEKPPPVFIRVLKYFFLFTLPGLVLCFTPFSWIELLFTLWSLLLVYIAGIQLVRWNQSRRLIKTRAKQLPSMIQRWSAIAVSIGFAILLLAYLVIKRASM